MKNILPLVILLAGLSGAAGASPEINTGVATTINNFNELTFSHVAVQLPIAPDPYREWWRPDTWSVGYGRLSRDGNASNMLMLGPLWRFDFLETVCNCFLDAGVSLTHLFEPDFYNEKRDRWESFGSHTQFTTRLGFGWYLDRQRQWAMSWNFSHISNGGLSEVNPGADFVGMELQFRY
ncbi:MAG TPA: acyloxyacyl hydrolase [Gammaproteobacteria bacterium]|nr:acyloxyacyl hydrolase [Gammaproteobacteria bacterium]